MLETQIFLPVGVPDCAVCREFDRAIRQRRPTNSTDADVVRAYTDPGRSDFADITLLRFHPALTAVKSYGNPEGPGMVYQCNHCGAHWDHFIWVLCGYETITCAKTNREERHHHTHFGPWISLVDLDGTQCSLSLTRTGLSLATTVNAERLSTEVQQVMQEHFAVGQSQVLDVMLNAELRCSSVKIPTAYQGTLKTVVARTDVPEERRQPGWIEEMINRLAGHDQVTRRTTVMPFVYVTLGSYSFQFETTTVDVLLDRVELSIGPLVYSSRHHLDEMDAHEDYVEWLFHLLESRRSPDELSERLADLRGRGLVADSLSPQIQAIPAHLRQAEQVYTDPADLRAWSCLVLNAPAVHLFHCGGHCGDAVDGPEHTFRQELLRRQYAPRT